MLDKSKYLELVKKKDNNLLIFELKNDFIVLIRSILDKNNIKYKENMSFNYYSTLLKSSLPIYKDNLNALSSVLNDTEYSTKNKFDFILNIYANIYKIEKKGCD